MVGQGLLPPYLVLVLVTLKSIGIDKVMIAGCIVVGIILCIIGFYINSELKQDEIAIEKAHIVVFALISFVTGIILVATERFWAIVFLFPYLIIRFFINKKSKGKWRQR